MTKSRNKVLIVGAGAGGVVVGYYFAKAGADVSFYVRPSKVDTLAAPLSLYCYDNADLLLLNDYTLVSNLGDIGMDYDFIVVTFDGTAFENPDNAELLNTLGQSAKAGKSIVMTCSVGPGVREMARAKFGLADDQIVCGTFNFLSHFISMPDQIFHPDVDQGKLGRAYVAFRNIGGKGGLFVDKENLSGSKRLAESYRRNGVQTVTLLPKIGKDVVFNAFFPFYAACELAGWPAGKDFVADKVYWPLACKAFKEIFALPAFGAGGKLLGWLLGPFAWKKLWLGIESGVWPLDANGFNKLHHGGKVAAQDTEILRRHLQAGRAMDRKMPNLERLVALLEKRRKMEPVRNS